MKWQDIITEEKKQYYIKMQQVLSKEYKNYTIYPPKNKIFYALETVNFDDINVVILGQDPYHGENQANGLAFSVNKNATIPPSLKNIFKEIKSQFGKNSQCINGDLTPWAKQGVLLLNIILTVRDSKPKSHHNIGWEIFTNHIIKKISDHHKNIVFLLWGKIAQKKEKVIDKSKHYILKSSHPSPLSSYRGFFGSDHFRKTNAFLKLHKKMKIDW